VVCERWELKFMMKKVKEASDLARFVARELSNLEYLMLIVNKLELLKESPFKYSRERLGKDGYGNPMFSIEVTGDIRILYSVDPKNCTVFIWEIGSHKDVYGRD
jgi:mRNA-degrading endonuclease RelE of RelBE toxin-antitoxin system